VDQLQRSHRFTIGVLLSVLVLSLATSGYLILVSQPRLANYVQLAKEARDIHEAMLDQETGLRGWLATGDGVFLAPYDEGRKNATEAVFDLLHDVRKSSDVTDRVLATCSPASSGRSGRPRPRAGGSPTPNAPTAR
jgi:CHASE3 domain sensor protein